MKRFNLWFGEFEGGGVMVTNCGGVGKEGEDDQE